MYDVIIPEELNTEMLPLESNTSAFYFYIVPMVKICIFRSVFKKVNEAFQASFLNSTDL